MQAIEPKRAFRGLWIPRGILFCPGLTLQGKFLLAEIDSLDEDGKGCFANNRHFEIFLDVERLRISRLINKLVREGFVISKLKRGKKGIERRLFLTLKTRNAYRPAGQHPLLSEKTIPGAPGCCPKRQGGIVQKDNTLINKDIRAQFRTHTGQVGEFVDYWNGKKTLSPITVVTRQRQKLIEFILVEKGIDCVKKLIDKLASSKFHTGQTKVSNWVAGVDWFLQNHHKVEELRTGGQIKVEIAEKKRQEEQQKLKQGWDDFLGRQTGERLQQIVKNNGRVEGKPGYYAQVPVDWVKEEIGRR